MAKKISDEKIKISVIINGDAAKKEYGELERANRKLLDSNKDMEEQAKKLAKTQGKTSDAYIKLKGEIDSNTTSVQKNEARMSDLTEEIGVANATMKQLSKESSRLRLILNNLDPNSQEWADYSKQLKAVKDRQSELYGQMRSTEDAMSEQIGILDQFSNGFMNIVSGMKSGNYKEVSEGFRSIAGGIGQATKATWAFIMTPIGAFLATLAAVGFIAKQWFDYNAAIKDSVILTEQITKLQGAQAEAIRLRNAALKETFGTDEKENLEVARNLVQQFGITYQEAFDVIEDGYIKGQKNNSQYLDSLREYPALVAEMGFSAQEFKDIITKGYDLGIYSDKLPDALKEFKLSIDEQTKGVRDAMLNAFGQTFTDELLKRVKTGETSTKDALQEVSKEAQRVGLNIQQNQQLTADLFRGAGEDAGGAVKIFQAVASAAKDANRPLTELEKSTKDLADANLRLEQAQSAALKGERYIDFSRDVKVFWVKTKALFFEAVKFITDLVINTTEKSVAFITSIVMTASALPTVLKKGIKDIAQGVLDTIKSLGGLGDVLDKLMKFDFSGAKASAKEFKKDFQKSFGDVKDSAGETIDTIVNLQKSAQQTVLDQFEKKRQGNVAASNADDQLKVGTDNEGSTEGDSSEGDAARSKALADLQAFEDQKRELLNRAALNAINDESERRKLKIEQDVESQKRDLENLLISEEKKNELKALIDAEANAAKEAIELERITTFNDKKKELEDQLALSKAQTDQEKELLKAEQDAEKRVLALEQLTLNEEEKKLLLADLEEQKQLTISDIKEKYREIELKKTQDFNNKLIAAENNLQTAKNNAIKSGLNYLAEAAGKQSKFGKMMFLLQKGMAIADVIRSSTQAVALAKANEASIPYFLSPGVINPAKLLSQPLTTKSILSTKLNAASSIATIAAQTITGFESGLYPVTRKQDGKKYNAGFGGKASTQIVGAPTTFLAGEMPEMIIDPNTFKKMDPQVIDYVLQLAGKRPMAAFESGKYPTETKATETSTTSNDAVILQNIEVMQQMMVTMQNLKINFTLQDEIKRTDLANKLEATKNSSIS